MRPPRTLLQTLLFCAACACGAAAEPRNTEASGGTDESGLATTNASETLPSERAEAPAAEAPAAEAPDAPLSVPGPVDPPRTVREDTPHGVAPQGAPARPEVSAQVLVFIAQMEEAVEAINMVRPLMMRIRTETTLPSEGAPPACSSDLRERVAEMIRRGMGPAASSLGSLRDAVDDLCARFERWQNPDENLRSRIARYLTHLDRIDEWMTDIRRCVDPGPYDFRCENTYGAEGAGRAEQAAAAMTVVQEVRAVLSGVPQDHPFPCYSSVWRRVEAMTWTMNIARAQIPGLVSSARSLCRSIGVDTEHLNAQVQVIHDRLDRSNASLVQLSASRQDALLRMRAINAGATTP